MKCYACTMKKYFASAPYSNLTDFTLLLVRVITGYAFILHGWDKILNPFGWMPGGAVPGIFQGLAAFAEFGGGVALIIGILTRLASFGLVITMAVAALMHAVAFGHPFVSKGGPSFEPAVSYFMISFMLLIFGPGRFSLDAKIFDKSKA